MAPDGCLFAQIQGGALILKVSVSRLGALAAVCLVSACGGTSGERNIDDNTPPAAPTALQATAPDPTHVLLQWTASPDSDTAGYRVFRNGTQIGTPVVASFTDTTVVAGTSYTYTVRAVDNAGNVSPDSNSVTATPHGYVAIGTRRTAEQHHVHRSQSADDQRFRCDPTCVSEPVIHQPDWNDSGAG